METTLAWSVIIVGFVLPLAHVTLSRNTGSWRSPPDSRCPFGPRTGWLVIIIMLGPVGWLMFIFSRRQKN